MTDLKTKSPTEIPDVIPPASPTNLRAAVGRDDVSKSPTTSPSRLRKSLSLDCSSETEKKHQLTSCGSIKRKSIRRRHSKRFDKVEETYGNDNEAYEAIRLRVLEERAVVNATEALQERWRMIMYMYHDCVDLNKGRNNRKLQKLLVKRQEELILIFIAFIALCFPISVFIIMTYR